MLLPFALLVVAAGAPETSEDHASKHFVLAAKIVAGTSRAADATTPLFGPGLDAELFLWDGGLELELAGAALLGHQVTSIPLELLLKKTFHVEERMDLFVAAGGIMNVVLHSEDPTSVVPGGIVLFGAYVWQGAHFGLVVEMAYAMLDKREHFEHDLEGAVGVAYRM
ncbi:MAG: hypothetical protein RIT81_44715 [Deltaproteobacteria bacterium]